MNNFLNNPDKALFEIYVDYWEYLAQACHDGADVFDDPKAPDAFAMAKKTIEAQNDMLMAHLLTWKRTGVTNALVRWHQQQSPQWRDYFLDYLYYAVALKEVVLGVNWADTIDYEYGKVEPDLIPEIETFDRLDQQLQAYIEFVGEMYDTLVADEQKQLRDSWERYTEYQVDFPF